MNQKIHYRLIIPGVLILGWIIFKNFDSNKYQISLLTPADDAISAKSENQGKVAFETNLEDSAVNAVTGNERNSTPTVKIKCVPVKAIQFKANEDIPQSGGKYWNKTHKFYLIESSVWFDLYNLNDEKIFRFPRFINADAAGKSGSIDLVGRDIRWRWKDDSSIIGVQQIIHKKDNLTLTGLDAEFPEIAPDAVRIYFYKISDLGTLYELIGPEVPAKFVIRIEGISDEGYISLAAVSPYAYNRGDDLKNDQDHYKYMGIYDFVR